MAWANPRCVLPSTSDNEQQVPKDALDFLGEVVSNGTEAEKADVSQLLAERLREPSISVKLKVLRVVMVLASKGGPGFAGHLRTKALPEMQAHTEFEAPPDPKHGEKPKLMIRAAAVKCIRTVEEQLAAPQPQPQDQLASAVQQLTAAVRQMESKSTAMDERLAGLEAWLADVEDKLAAQPAGAPAADSSAALQQLQAAQADAVRRLDRLDPAAERLPGVEQQLASVVAEMRELKASVGEANQQRDTRLQRAEETALANVAGMEGRIGALEALQASSAEAASASLASLRTELAQEREQRLAASAAGSGAASAAAAPPSSDALVALQKQMAAVEVRLAEQEDTMVSLQPDVATAQTAEATAPQGDAGASVSSAQFSEWADLQTQRMAALEEQFARSVEGAQQVREIATASGDGVSQLGQKISALETSHASSSEAAQAELASLRTELLAAKAADGGAAGTAGQLDSEEDADSRASEAVGRVLSSLGGLCVGDRCEVVTDGCRGNGTVGFAGTVDGKDGFWLGVSMDEAKGRNDGSVQGRRYFECPQNHGVFVPPEKVRKIAVREAMAAALEEERGMMLATMAELRKDLAKDCDSKVQRVDGRVEAIGAEIGPKVSAAAAELGVRLSEQEGLLSIVDETVQQMEQTLTQHKDSQQKAEAALRSELQSLCAAAAPENIEAKVTATVALSSAQHTQQFESLQQQDARLQGSVEQLTSSLASVDAEVKRLTGTGGGFATADDVKRVEAQASGAEAAATALETRVAELDTRLGETNSNLDEGQDAYQKRIEALETWLQKVEEKSSATAASVAQSAEATQTLGSEVRGMVEDERGERTQILTDLARGIKKEIDAVKGETEATEGKVLELLKQHMTVCDQKLVGREEYERFAEDSEERCKALEERTDSVLEQARGQVTTAETAIVQLQQQWDSHAQQAERQQEPLSIRVSSVEVRYEDDKSSKP